ncbi:E3 ubiquitin-protein ligase SIRP1-like [Olea europaea var. sylvestris]|uniref:E3 ubiquitin-protein ligase SIRP1-like n=1 Tax=Olea europaea var. sylvestris TaxID=158386 RepID=UPI000C1D6525|nr:E3 ubiquitin-protein ligase SIRP1-like [Olea europaea var. sylvestris]XP_022857221.1 E3 ubiquitin-protein ligase SIRP1-like [Olea europaea var. sylvestris]
MDEADASRYWCHVCLQTVNPVVDIETIKCPICQSGFIEEMASADAPGNDDFGHGGSDSDRTLSIWAPILLGMMSNPRRRHRSRFRRMEFEDDDYEDGNDNNNSQREGDMELDPALDSLTRRRSSAAVIQLLHGIRNRMVSELGNSQRDQRDTDRDDIRDGESVILINPFNQTIVVQGSHDSNNDSLDRAPIGSLGDYYIGPGLELLLQHLAENDPNRYGTPPAKKDAVEALPTTKIGETLQCSVCLEDFEVGAEAKEMPCKHKFHTECILPWLELHSSCPVCRYQLPSDESKVDSAGSRNNSNIINVNNNSGNLNGGGGDERNEEGRRFSIPIPWPFSSLFSSSTSQSRSGNSSSTSPSGSSANAPSTTSNTPDDN